MKRPGSASATEVHSEQSISKVCGQCQALAVKKEERGCPCGSVKHRLFLCERLTAVRSPAGSTRHMTRHMTRHEPPPPLWAAALTENECLYKASAASDAWMLNVCLQFSPLSPDWLLLRGGATSRSLVFGETQGSPIKVTDAVRGPGLNEGVSPLFAAQRDILRRGQRLQCDTLVVPWVTVAPPPWAPPPACGPWRWCWPQTERPWR